MTFLSPYQRKKLPEIEKVRKDENRRKTTTLKKVKKYVSNTIFFPRITKKIQKG